MPHREKPAIFTERQLGGIDEDGAEERVMIWIERRPGALWAVGRIVNPQLRPTELPREDDYFFEGYELEDALDAANGALADDGRVSNEVGASGASAFTREELLEPLERWFFGHLR